MRGYSKWSYRPYRPLEADMGEIYICRIVPSAHAIHFEWLNEDEPVCEVFYRKRAALTFLHWGAAEGGKCDITGLLEGQEYEFYVQSGEKKSRVRLARCADAIGTVVNYLHPDDQAYAFSGHYLCSPSLLRHPDGYLLSSMDVFDRNHPQNLTMIFRSDDDGVTWYYVCDLMPCFWGKLFLHKGEVYVLSCATQYGDILIGKSPDGGMTFDAPVVLLRGSGGRNLEAGPHKNPQNIMRYNGRIYETLEWGTWSGGKKEFYAAMVMSCDENDDLLVPENWSFSKPRRFVPFAPEIAHLPADTRTIEGTLTVAPDGRLLNIMRFENTDDLALLYAVNTEDYDAPLEYAGCMKFPAHRSKFMIKYDPCSRAYYSIATRIYSKERPDARNLLSLMVSKDLQTWTVAVDLFDYREENWEKYGFQYVDFEIEGDDIIYLCRTALNEAHNLHDTNYQTFHRLKNFRQYAL